MKRRTKLVLAIAGVLAIPCVGMATLWFVLFGSCGGNEQAASMARGLSKQRLERLFVDMQGMSRAQGTVPLFLVFEHGKKIPDAIADLHPRGLTLRDRKAIVYLSGCMDDKVGLRVSGLGSGKKGEIVLWPGDAKDPVVLWVER